MGKSGSCHERAVSMWEFKTGPNPTQSMLVEKSSCSTEVKIHCKQTKMHTVGRGG